MSSNRLPPLFRTMKFRVAIWYAALFVIASGATFISVYFTLSSNMTKRLDKELRADSSELENAYLPGPGYLEGAAWLPASGLPPEIVNVAAGKEFKPFKGRPDGEKGWQLVALRNGKAYELRISEAGALEKELEIPLGEKLRQLEGQFNLEAHAEGVKNVFFLLLSPERKILAKSPLEPWPGVEEAAWGEVPMSDGVFFRTIRVKNHRERIRVMDLRFPDGQILQIGKGMKREDSVLRAYISIASSVFIVMLVCGSAIGWLIAMKSMAGVERLGKAVRAVGQGDFSMRVSERNAEGEEIAQLVSAFNEMASRIQRLVQELKMVTDNIAHDMRTPLTRIKGMLELALSNPACSGEWRETACNVAEECDKLIQMINTMLEITQTEGGLATLSAEPLDFAETARSAHSLFMPLAEEKHIVFKLETPEEPLVVMGDKFRMQRVIANLLDNAIKYTPEGGEIVFSLAREGQELRLSVRDSGCGIAQSEQELVFDRFYRCDSSRSLPGNGLGLSLVHAIVKAHHGRIELESTPGKGSCFTVILPS